MSKARLRGLAALVNRRWSASTSSAVAEAGPYGGGGQGEVERIPAEGRDREKLEPTGHLITGTPREVAFDQ